MTGSEYVIATVLGSLAQKLFGSNEPAFQARNSFQFTATPPAGVMSEEQGNLRGLRDVMNEKLNRGVQLRSSYAQDLPSFGGGAMPLQVGVTGHDPALGGGGGGGVDMSYLTRPGYDLGKMSGSQNTDLAEIGNTFQNVKDATMSLAGPGFGPAGSGSDFRGKDAKVWDPMLQRYTDNGSVDDGGRDMSDEQVKQWNQFFSGNPYGAFTGGNPSGVGDQFYSGGGRPKVQVR